MGRGGPGKPASFSSWQPEGNWNEINRSFQEKEVIFIDIDTVLLGYSLPTNFLPNSEIRRVLQNLMRYFANLIEIFCSAWQFVSCELCAAYPLLSFWLQIMMSALTQVRPFSSLLLSHCSHHITNQISLNKSHKRDERRKCTVLLILIGKNVQQTCNFIHCIPKFYHCPSNF